MLSSKERLGILQKALSRRDQMAPEVAIWATIPALSTVPACREAKAAAALGADAIMALAPAYIRPSQAEIEVHFEVLAKAAAPAPVVLYENPSRVSCRVADKTLLGLAKKGLIAGVKDASDGAVLRLPKLFEVGKPIFAQRNFKFYAGNDEEAMGYLKAGGSGLVSILANLVPKKLAGMLASRDEAAFLDLIKRLDPVVKAGNPAGIKFALSAAGLAPETMCLPLLPPAKEVRQKIASLALS